MRFWIVFVVAITVMSAGCDNKAEIERIIRLERQNKDL